MLNENDVVEAVCKHLQREGYEILERCQTTEHGVDIIAQHPQQNGRLLVEAKGATSSLVGSARYGKGFTANQVWDRVAKGFYTAVRLHEENGSSNDKVAMALPDNSHFQKYLRPIKSSADSLGITIFLASGDHTVQKF